MSDQENKWKQLREDSFSLPDPCSGMVQECLDRIEELEADREIYLLSPKPGDVVVFRTDMLNQHERGGMASALQSSFPNNRVVVVQKTQSLLAEKKSDD